MVLIKKYGVWLALLFTLAVTVWVSQQEETEGLVTATGKNAEALNGEKKIIITQLELHKTDTTETKQDSQSVTKYADLGIQRSLDNDVPKNIFTPFASIQNNPDMNTEPVITLPANPFVYAGKVIEDGSLVVFLIDGEKNHAVKSGDVIEDIWKVKSITPPTMTLKYIPLKFEIQMEIGANS